MKRLPLHLPQSSDLFKLVNKSKTSKSVQGLRDYLKSTRQTLPKAALTRPGHSRADKTVCSEEELKAIQKEHHQSGGLSLNKPYLKSVTDLMSPTTKSTKSEKRDKSESSKNGKKRERERRS